VPGAGLLAGPAPVPGWRAVALAGSVLAGALLGATTVGAGWAPPPPAAAAPRAAPSGGAAGREAGTGPAYGPTTRRSGRHGARRREAVEDGVVASARFRHDVGTSAAALVGAVDQLQQAVAAGDVAGARADELAAQGDVDAIRYVTADGPTTSGPVDGTAAALPAGGRLAGLHLVERDLWDGGGSTSAAAPAVSALVAEAPLMEVGLSRLQLGPRGIDLVAMRDLGWVTSVAVPGLEERSSHLDAVDVAATVGAARTAFAAVAPLGRLVAPARTASVTRRLALLGRAVRAMGPPSTVPDDAVPQPAWRAVAQRADAAAAELGALAPALAGYGPRQIYGYNA
jgi:iron uptake system component EfeO